MRLLIALDTVQAVPAQVEQISGALQAARGASKPSAWPTSCAPSSASELQARVRSVHEERRQHADADAAGRAAAQRRARDRVQPERLRRIALGRTARQRQSCATCKRHAPARTAQAHAALRRMVPHAHATAARHDRLSASWRARLESSQRCVHGVLPDGEGVAKARDAQAGGAVAAASALDACGKHGSDRRRQPRRSCATRSKSSICRPAFTTASCSTPASDERRLSRAGPARRDGLLRRRRRPLIVLMRNHEMTEAPSDALADPYNPGPGSATRSLRRGRQRRRDAARARPGHARDRALEPRAVRHVLELCGRAQPVGLAELRGDRRSATPRLRVPVRDRHAIACCRRSRITGYGRMRHEAACGRSRHAHRVPDRRSPGRLLLSLRADATATSRSKARCRRCACAITPRSTPRRCRRGRASRSTGSTSIDPDAADDSVRMQAQAKGAARVCRGEGLWLARRSVLLRRRRAAPSQRGQVSGSRHGDEPTLEVVAERTDVETLDMPDNMCVSPHGQLYVAEDGTGGNFLRRIDARRPRVAVRAQRRRAQSEFAGPCFSPDGATLFVNIQGDGLTLAIRGPFERPLPGESAVARARRTAGPDFASRCTRCRQRAGRACARRVRAQRAARARRARSRIRRRAQAL